MRQLILNTIVLMFATLAATPAFGFEVGDFVYEVTSAENKTVKLTGYKYNNSDVTRSVDIPNTVMDGNTEYKVTGIGSVFTNCKFSNVNIPFDVTTIEANAFKDCSIEIVYLKSFWMSMDTKAFNGSVIENFWSYSPDNEVCYGEINCVDLYLLGVTKVTSAMIGQNKYVRNYMFGEIYDAVTIADGAFRGCSNLSMIELDCSKVTSIGKNAFADCPKLEHVKLPKSVTSIGEKLFEGSGTDSPYINLYYNPENCESVADGAFNGVAFLTIASSVNTIPKHAFKDCYSLRSVNFTDNLQVIGNEAFSGCHELRTISDLPSTLKTIGDSAFYGCGKIDKLIFAGGSHLETIGSEAFRGCSKLKNLDLPASLKNIGDYAFCGCTALNSVTIPLSLTSLNTSVFKNTQLTTVNYNAKNCNNTDYSSPLGTKVSSVTIGSEVETIPVKMFQDALITTVTIPASVTRIDNNSFQFCRNLETVTFQENSKLKTIGDWAFERCNALKKIEIPSSVESIEGGAFETCENLEAVTFQKDAKLQTIGNEAFGDCSQLTTMDLPASLRRFGGYTFEGCVNLQSVTIPWSLESLYEDTFKGCEKLTKVNFNACRCLVGSSPPFGSKVTEVNIGDGVGTIPSNIFKDTSIKNITIPSSVDLIEESAFQNCKKLETVTISENSNLRWVWEYAFEGCSALKTIYFPSKIFTIRKSAYSGTALTEITIPAATSEIGDNAFSNISSKEVKVNYNANCNTVGKNVFAGTNVISAVFSEGVKSIPNLFQDCSTLSSVKLPSTLKSIADNTFSGCTQLGDVIFAENAILKTIGNGAFNNCSALTYLSIPSSVETIGNNAFQKCMSLATLKIESNSNLKTIGDNAFQECVFGAVTIPASVETIGDNAFLNCVRLGTVDIQNNSVLKTIGNGAFKGCVGLKNFNIPSTLQTIGSTAFSNTKLTQITIPALTHKIGDNAFSNISSDEVKLYYNANCDTVGKSVFSNTKIISAEVGEGVLSLPNLFQENSKLESVKISSTVQAIADNTFMGCGQLSDVTFAENTNLKTIGNSAFQSCMSLGIFTIPSSVESIGNSAFQGCRQLSDVTFAENTKLKTIGNSAFQSCMSLGIFTIPSSVESIGSNAFQGCMSLETMVVKNNSRLKTIGDGAFNGCDFLRGFTIPSSVESVGDNAFQGCLDLARVNIENDSKLKAIGNSAFDGCTALQTINMPSTLQTIGNSAFHSTALSEITIPSSVRKIGNNAFMSILGDEVNVYYNANCDTIGTSVFYQTNITSVEIGEGVTSLPDLFQDNLKLKSVKISSTVKSIANNAFYYCAGLSDVTFAENSKLKTIGDYAFYYCSALANFTMPSFVESIGKYAFKECDTLTSVTIPSTVTSIGEEALCCAGLTSVYSKITDLSKVTCLDCFHTDNYSKARLYVPSGCEPVYSVTNPWSNFYISEAEKFTTADYRSRFEEAKQINCYKNTLLLPSYDGAEVVTRTICRKSAGSNGAGVDIAKVTVETDGTYSIEYYNPIAADTQYRYDNKVLTTSGNTSDGVKVCDYFFGDTKDGGDLSGGYFYYFKEVYSDDAFVPVYAATTSAAYNHSGYHISDVANDTKGELGLTNKANVAIADVDSKKEVSYNIYKNHAIAHEGVQSVADDISSVGNTYTGEIVAEGNTYGTNSASLQFSLTSTQSGDLSNYNYTNVAKANYGVTLSVKSDMAPDVAPYIYYCRIWRVEGDTKTELNSLSELVDKKNPTPQWATTYGNIQQCYPLGETQNDQELTVRDIFTAERSGSTKTVKYIIRIYTTNAYKDLNASAAPALASNGDAETFNPECFIVESSCEVEFNNDQPTGVEGIYNQKAVSNVRYYNMLGVASTTPFNGVNIVVTTYTDGTQSTTKMRK